MKTVKFIKSALLMTLAFAHGATYAIDDIPDQISGWTEQGTVLRSGATGQWDEKIRSIGPIGLTLKDGVYYLFYRAGFDGCWDTDGDINHMSIGLATSTDGVNFTKYSGNPVLKPHDFVSVSSHEEGIRIASIRYLPDQGVWLGYFGVESPGGSNSCPFMGSTNECRCNVSVDASIFAATSSDGKDWTVLGEVDGVYNGETENYIDDFLFVDGQYSVWTHTAEGGGSLAGHTHRASQGTDYMDLAPVGEISELCWGWSQVRSFLHNDDNRVTLIYDPNGGCAPSGTGVYFADTSLDDINVLTNIRKVHTNDRETDNVIIKDTAAGVWRWYFNNGRDTGELNLRTHPLADADDIPPGSPSELSVE